MILTNEVDYRMDGPVAIITLNRPDKLNVMNSGMRAQLIDAWTRFEADPDARVAILTGAGERAFCAGRDLNDETAYRQEDFLPMMGDSVHVSKPVIAAVNGLAYGAGWFLVQGCDLCIASEHASFALPEAKVGRAPVWACWLLGVIPQKVILELLMTGNSISASRAYEIGLVNHVVPAEDLLSRALLLARDIATAAPLCVMASKKMVYMAAGLDRDEALQAALKLMNPIYRSADALEGVRAFREKRVPVWQGL